MFPKRTRRRRRLSSIHTRCQLRLGIPVAFLRFPTTIEKRRYDTDAKAGTNNRQNRISRNDNETGSHYEDVMNIMKKVMSRLELWLAEKGRAPPFMLFFPCSGAAFSCAPGVWSLGSFVRREKQMVEHILPEGLPGDVTPPSYYGTGKLRLYLLPVALACTEIAFHRASDNHFWFSSLGAGIYLYRLSSSPKVRSGLRAFFPLFLAHLYQKATLHPMNIDTADRAIDTSKHPTHHLDHSCLLAACSLV